jgi:hypothetical protein
MAISIIAAVVGAVVGASALAPVVGAVAGGIIGTAIGGGISSVIRGGDFWDGFISSGIGSLVGNFVGDFLGSFADSAISGSLAQDTMLMDQLDGFSFSDIGGDITGELGWGTGGSDILSGSAGSEFLGGDALFDSIIPSSEISYGTNVPYDEAGMDIFSKQLSDMPFIEEPDSSSLLESVDYKYTNPYSNLYDQNYVNNFPIGSGMTPVGINDPTWMNPSYQYSNLGTDNITPTLTSGGATSSSPSSLEGMFSSYTDGINQTPFSESVASGQSIGGSPTGYPPVATPPINPTASAGTPEIPKTFPQQQQVSSNGGFMSKTKDVINKSDSQLRDLFKIPRTAKGSPTVGLGLSLFDSYQKMKYADEMEKALAGSAPLSYSDWMQKAYNPTNYRMAAANLAQAGRTGVLPILMARMNSEGSQNYYNNYLPNMNAKYLPMKAQVSAAKRNAINSPTNYLATMMGWGA